MANQDRPNDDAFSEPVPEPFPEERTPDPEPVSVGAGSQQTGGSGAEPTRRPASRIGSRVRREPSGDPDNRSGAGETARLAVRRVRELLATAVLTVAVLAALMLALGAVLVGLDANQDNTLVSAVLDFAHRLDGPFADVFTFGDAVKQTLVNWGIAAAVYLIIGRVLERAIRP